MRSLFLLFSFLLIYHVNAQYRTTRFVEPMEYEWRWPAERSPTWNAYPDEGMVALKETVIHDLKNFKNELNQETGFGREVHTVSKFHFRTGDAILAFMDEAIYLSPYYTLLAYDGRIIHENGEVTDLTRREFPAAKIPTPHRNDHELELLKRDIPLIPGDQLEMVLSYRIWTFSLLYEVLVHADHPIKEKVIVVQWQKEIMTPHFMSMALREPSETKVFTYNEWPLANVHETENSKMQSWTFTDLEPLPTSPYKILKTEYPFFSIGTVDHIPSHELIRSFNNEYPYVKYSGRKNMHAFLEHVEARKRVLKDRPVLDLIRDIVAFVSDSITMVPDEEMEAATPIGSHFHDRVLSPEKTVVLYRQLMSILEIPLYVCFTRDRYEGAMIVDTLHAEYLETHLLAFRDPATKKLHYIMPRTLTENFLLAELPYWIAGQKALMMELTNGNEKYGEPEPIDLPNSRLQENLFSERMVIEIGDISDQATGRGRGTMTGQVRMVPNADRIPRAFDPLVRGNMPYPPLRHKTIDSLVTDVAKLKTTYQFNAALAPVDPGSWARNGEVEFDIASLVSLPTFGNSIDIVPINSLLPYPHVSRMDIHLRFTEPIGWASFGDEISIENAIGELRISCTLNKELNTVHWHLEQVLKNTWLDEVSHRSYSELMASINDPKNYRIKIRKPLQAPTSP